MPPRSSSLLMMFLFLGFSSRAGRSIAARWSVRLAGVGRERGMLLEELGEDRRRKTLVTFVQ